MYLQWLRRAILLTPLPEVLLMRCVLEIVIQQSTLFGHELDLSCHPVTVDHHWRFVVQRSLMCNFFDKFLFPKDIALLDYKFSKCESNKEACLKIENRLYDVRICTFIFVFFLHFTYTLILIIHV